MSLGKLDVWLEYLWPVGLNTVLFQSFGFASNHLTIVTFDFVRRFNGAKLSCSFLKKTESGPSSMRYMDFGQERI